MDPVLFGWTGNLLQGGGFDYEFVHNPSQFPSLQGFGQMLADGTFTWSVAVTNGRIHRITEANEGRLMALQDVLMGTNVVTCFGLYDGGPSLVPVTEVQLPALKLPVNTRERIHEQGLSNGMVVLTFNHSNSVGLLAFNTDGSIAWARELTSSEFPSVPPQFGSPERSVFVDQLGVNEILLSISANEKVGTTNTAKIVFVKIDASGAIQWAKKLHVPLVPNPFFEAQSPYPAGLHRMPAGDLVLTVGDFEIDASFNVKSLLTLVRLDPDRTVKWGRRFEHASFNYAPVGIENDATVLGLHGGTLRDSLVCVLNSTGALTGSVQMESPGTGSFGPTGASPATGKIYYAGLSRTNSSAATGRALIGQSSASLTNISTLAYSPRETINSVLLLNADERLTFIGLSQSNRETDLVFLDSNLEAQSSCPLFTPTNVMAIPVTVTNVPVVLSSTNIIVQSSNLMLSLAPAALTISLSTPFSEQAICSAPAAPPLAAKLTSSAIVLSWPTSALAFALQFTTNLSQTNWSTATPPPVVSGKNNVVTNATSGGARFYRLRKP